MSGETVSGEIVEKTITDEDIEKLRGMIGVKLRLENGGYIREASTDTIVSFSNGIGDVNPLYRDSEYGKWTRFGGMIAHPLFPYALYWPGRTHWGLPGIHGFFAGNDWQFYRNVRAGERINAYVRVVGIEEKQSKFSGRLVIQYTETIYTNNRDERVARVLGWCTRHERKAARENKKYENIKKDEYSKEQLDTIYRVSMEEREKIRGKRTRYWEDVNVGDDLEPIVRGPLSLHDTMGFLVACGRGHTHGLLLSEALSHPAHYFQNLEAGGGIEYTGIGHHREDIAREVGVPGAYDYGPQRISWLGSLVTNWMGDDGFMVRLRGEIRRFNIFGDTTWLKGKVSGKRIQNGYPLVDLEVWAENQRGEKTAPGSATVALPSRDPRNEFVINGEDIEIDLPFHVKGKE